VIPRDDGITASGGARFLLKGLLKVPVGHGEQEDRRDPRPYVDSRATGQEQDREGKQDCG
jgi:hypothetical protein